MTTADRFRTDALANPCNAAILGRLPALGLDQPWLVAGCLYQTVWNLLSDRQPGESIKDYDLFYWDEDTSWEAEDAVIRRGADLFGDLGVEVEIRNQKRVPLWFEERFGSPYPPIARARDGIGRFLVECTCVGLSPDGTLCAPFGLDDLYAGTLRWNDNNPTPQHFEAKCASYRARWPWLQVADRPASHAGGATRIR